MRVNLAHNIDARLSEFIRQAEIPSSQTNFCFSKQMRGRNVRNTKTELYPRTLLHCDKYERHVMQDLTVSYCEQIS